MECLFLEEANANQHHSGALRSYQARLWDNKAEPLRTDMPAQIVSEVGYQKDNVNLLFEDEDLIVISKRGGITTRLGRAILLGPSGYLGSIAQRHKVVPAHRIDRCTSGILMFTKNKATLLVLQKQLALGQIPKRYYALVSGIWPAQWKTSQAVAVPMTKGFGAGAGLITVNRSGFHSLTTFWCLRSWRGFALLAVTPRTGRTHQIRVHCKWLGLSIVGDAKYGRPNPNQWQMMLHSAYLAFQHPHKPYRLSLFSAVPKLLCAFTHNLESRTTRTNTGR